MNLTKSSKHKQGLLVSDNNAAFNCQHKFNKDDEPYPLCCAAHNQLQEQECMVMSGSSLENMVDNQKWRSNKANHKIGKHFQKIQKS